jgi:hypothetical protein
VPALLGGSAAVIEVAAGQSTLASALKLFKKVILVVYTKVEKYVN